MDNTRIFMTLGVFALFMVGLVISQYHNTVNKMELEKKRRAEYGNIRFTGKVMGYKTYRFMNKNYYRICVRLDSAMSKPLLIFNDDDAIEIRDSVAIFSAGFLNPVLGPADSVAVNADNGGKIILHYKANAIEKRDLSFEPMGLTKNDLDGCN